MRSEIDGAVLVIDGEGSGGMAHYASNLAMALAAHCAAELYTVQPEDGLVASAPVGRLLDGFERGRRLRRNYNPWRYRRIARTIVANYRPSICHIVSRVPGLGALIDELQGIGTKVVCTIHDPSPHEERRTAWGRIHTRFTYSHSLPKTLRRCAALHVHSHRHASELAQRYDVSEPERRIYVVQHGGGIAPAIAAGERVPPELGVGPARDETLLFFGRIEPYKGVDVLFDALCRLIPRRPRFKLLIAGAGRLPAIPDELRRHLVLINRFVHDDEIRAIFNAARFVVLPYTAATQSGVIPMAASFSMPAIVTRVGALPELVRHGETGAIVAASDAQSLADAVLALLDSPDEARRQGQAAKSLMESTYSWNAVAAAHVRAYRTRLGVGCAGARA